MSLKIKAQHPDHGIFDQLGNARRRKGFLQIPNVTLPFWSSIEM